LERLKGRMSETVKIDIKPIVLLRLPRKDGEMFEVMKKALSPSASSIPRPTICNFEVINEVGTKAGRDNRAKIRRRSKGWFP
jgi:hypothetical protein